MKLLLIGFVLSTYRHSKHSYVPQESFQEFEPQPQQEPQEFGHYGMPRADWLRIKKEYNSRYQAWKEEMGPQGLKQLKDQTIAKGKRQRK
jgi:hypothetical protein